MVTVADSWRHPLRGLCFHSHETWAPTNGKHRILISSRRTNRMVHAQGSGSQTNRSSENLCRVYWTKLFYLDAVRAHSSRRTHAWAPPPRENVFKAGYQFSILRKSTGRSQQENHRFHYTDWNIFFSKDYHLAFRSVPEKFHRKMTSL